MISRWNWVLALLTRRLWFRAAIFGLAAVAASLGVAPGRFPNLEAHHARMLARPAVARTIAAEAAIGYELPA